MSRRPLQLAPDEMRALGEPALAIVIRHFEENRDKCVARTLPRAETERRFRTPVPEQGTPPAELLGMLERDIFSNSFHTDHPRFYAFVPSPSNYVSVMGDLLTSAHNLFAGPWMASSAAGQLELNVLDWLCEIVGYGEGAGGILVSGGSMANLSAIAAVRETKLGGPNEKAVVYCSNQTHSSLAKALRVRRGVGSLNPPEGLPASGEDGLPSMKWGGEPAGGDSRGGVAYLPMRSADHPTRSILALGSAAVIAVYAAGYVRTKPAAAKLAAESSARRRPAAQDSRGVTVAEAPPVKAIADSASKVAAAPKAKAKSTPTSDKQKLIDDPESAAAESAAVAKLREEQERPTKFIVPPLNYVPPPKVAPTKADSMTKPELPPWNDGTYVGWGTSRHGDIKAAVEIRGGAIARAYISECLTRYSCSWVEHLPRQVIDRQSPGVDNVTSATESANAFYYAIFSALKQAK